MGQPILRMGDNSIVSVHSLILYETAENSVDSYNETPRFLARKEKDRDSNLEDFILPKSVLGINFKT